MRNYKKKILKKMVSNTKFGFGSQLRIGKMLTPHVCPKTGFL